MDKIVKKKQGIILIIVLWVMFFLSVVVLVLGAKNRMDIRLRSLSNENLRMFYLAEEGVSRAIDVLIKDDLQFDALTENWSQNISLKTDQGILDIQIIDENRFININNVSEEILNNIKTLFPEISSEQAQEIIKNRPFNLKSEIIDLLNADALNLTAIQSMQSDLIDMITTLSNGMLNINTASEKVMLLVPNMSEVAVQSIIAHRQSSPFMNNDELSSDLSLIGLTPGQISSLLKCSKIHSNVFRIIVNAQSKDKHISRNLEVVVRRQDDKISVLLFKEN